MRDGAGPQNGITGEEEGIGRRRRDWGAEAGRWVKGESGEGLHFHCSMDV